jgi:hypothetical protein
MIFRRMLYGRFSTAVPPIFWTPHQDRPLPGSDAQAITITSAPTGLPEVADDLPFVPGQMLYGVMIPRPRQEFQRNQEESRKAKERFDEALAQLKEKNIVTPPKLSSQKTVDFDLFGPDMEDGGDLLSEEGFEVADLEDEELFIGKCVLGIPEDSLCESRVIHEEAGGDRASAQHNNDILDLREAQYESLQDIGIEVTNFYDEARFVEMNWRGSPSSNENDDAV